MGFEHFVQCHKESANKKKMKQDDDLLQVIEEDIENTPEIDWAESKLLQSILLKQSEYHLTEEPERGLNIQSDEIKIGKSNKNTKDGKKDDRLSRILNLIDQLRKDFEQAQVGLVFDTGKFKEFLQGERYQHEYDEGLKVIEQVYADLGILNCFKPVANKKNFQFTLNLLKHAHFLQVFKEDFERFLKSMHSYITKMFPQKLTGMVAAMNMDALRANPVASLDRLANEQASVAKEIEDLQEWVAEVRNNYYWKRMFGANSKVIFDGQDLRAQLDSCSDQAMNCL